MISFREVEKSFKDKEVLQGFSLEVPEGETTVVIGYSGSGKSVSLKHVVGLLDPDRGEVEVDGEVVHASGDEIVAFLPSRLSRAEVDQLRQRAQDRVVELLDGELGIAKVTLEGLEPETDYHYRVRSVNPGGDSVESDLHPLKTAVRRGTPFSFAVTSETGGYGDD